MTHTEAARYWEENADTWTALVRAGCDVYRDHLNTPAFFEMLPDVSGLAGLDIGCGEGHNLGQRGIGYCRASGVELPFAGATFDFVTAFMSVMDMPDTARVLAEAARVLTPGGFFQFSIEHPCFSPLHRQKVLDAQGRTRAIEVGDYFRNLNGEVSEWLFKAAPPHLGTGLRRFRIPRFTHTLSEWMNLLLDAGFTIERVGEPRPSDDAVRAQPRLQDAQVVGYFLHIRARSA